MLTAMNGQETPAEITAWFHVWGAYSRYGESFNAAVEFQGREFRATMDRIYGKLGSSDVQLADSLRISTDTTLPFPVAEIVDAPGRSAAAQAGKEAYELVRDAIRTLAFRIVEYLRMERPDLQLGRSADRGSHQPLGREHQVDVQVTDTSEPELLFPLWTWTADEAEPDFDGLPLLKQENFSRAVRDAIAAPSRSRILRQDAHEHRRSGDFWSAIVFAVTACETRFREVATTRFAQGWQALLEQRKRPTFGAARLREATVFGTTYAAYDPSGDAAMKAATDVRNDLIHNVLTTPAPTEADADAVFAAVVRYWAWLDDL